MATFTDRDHEIVVMTWECFKSPPQVDYHKLAELGNYKTNASASTTFSIVKKKMLSGTKFSERDREILVMAWQCFKSLPEIDYKKLQEKGNYKTTASASTTFSIIKKKLLSGLETNKEASDIKANSGKRKKKAPDELQGDEPKKKRTKKAAATKAENANANDDTADGSREASHEAVKREPNAAEDEPVDEKLFATAQEYIKNEEAEED